MGWRFVWFLIIERDHDETGSDVGSWPRLVKWAIVGLAVIGVSTLLVVKGWIS